MEINNKVSGLKSALHILKNSFAEYPAQSFTVISSIVVTGFAESFGLLTFLPLLQLGLRKSGNHEPQTTEETPSFVDQTFTSFFDFIGIEPTLGVLLGFIVLMITLKSLSTLVTQAYIGFVAARVSTNLRLDLIKSLLNTSWRHFVAQPTGRLSNAISTEAQRASNTYLSAWSMMGALIQTGCFVLASAAVSVEILIYGLGAGIFINILLHWTVKMARTAGTAETNLMNSLISRLSDNISGIKPLKAMGLENKIFPLLEGDSEGLRQAQKKQSFANAAQQSLPEPLMMAIMAFGAFYALQNLSITLAHLAVVALLFSRMVGRISQFQKYYQMINVSESAYRSIHQAIDDAKRATSTRSGDFEPPALEKMIEFKDIHFSYDPEVPILRNLSLSLPAHKLTALIGPSGCGKTTIVDLVTGLLEPQSGEIMVDGHDLNTINMQKWRESIGYVPQELYLFHDTIKNNITLKDHDVNDERVWTSLKRCGAEDFVRALPEGLETVIGERGSKLSGGQRQRLMIARALVRAPKLLILDEATTALDPETEKALCKTVQELSEGVTILAISHQPAIKDIADQVIDMTKISY